MRYFLNGRLARTLPELGVTYNLREYFGQLLPQIVLLVIQHLDLAVVHVLTLLDRMKPRFDLLDGLLLLRYHRVLLEINIEGTPSRWNKLMPSHVTEYDAMGLILSRLIQ